MLLTLTPSSRTPNVLWLFSWKLSDRRRGLDVLVGIISNLDLYTARGTVQGSEWKETTFLHPHHTELAASACTL